MERKRENGKFVRETADERAARHLASPTKDEVEAEEGEKRVRRPSLRAARLNYCRKLASHKVAEAMPSIVDALVEQVTSGSLEHTKQFLKFAAADQAKAVPEAPRRRGKGFAQRLLEELRSRRQPEKPPEPEAVEPPASEDEPVTEDAPATEEIAVPATE